LDQDDLSDNLINRIAGYLLIEHTEIGPADLCLVFGNRFVCPQLAAQAAALYKQGLVKKIAASGGVLTSDGRTEAAAIRDELLRLGIPADDILVEDRAANSGENVVFTKNLAAKTLGPDAVRSVIGIGHISAGRRFLMTLAKQWPEVLPMYISVNPYPVAPADWARHQGFRQKVLEEWGKIAGYKEKGFIEEVDIDAINRRVNGQPPPAPGPGP
jgi:uncharacterized SAM-binding protein YcdF (DUF218 family)